MKTYIAVIMALATLRTIVPFANPKTYHERASKIFATFVVAVTQVIAFWYLCEILFSVK